MPRPPLYSGLFLTRFIKYRIYYYNIYLFILFSSLQGLFPPGQGATIGVDFMIKTVEIKGEKVKEHGKRATHLYIWKCCLTAGTHFGYYISPAADMGHSRPGEISLHHSELLP